MSNRQEQEHAQRHNHTFGQDQKRSGEVRTIIVIVITATMMVVEIATGVIFGSIALLADGLHMASHAAALTINAFAYIYARRQAHSGNFSFGTGKVNALGGYTGAILLAIFALIMVWESINRLLNPVEIAFNQAILVAILGLIVNGASVFILGEQHEGSHESNHENDDTHDHHHDHNLRSAYLHVLADTLTSVLAIFALLAGKFIGLSWMDPLMGIVGAILVARWSWGLIRNTSEILLDRQGPATLRNRIRHTLEDGTDTQVTDLHLWSIGPNLNSAIISLQTSSPKPPDEYKNQLLSEFKIAHLSVEVNPTPKE
jgi:cation diffusion facilitator family transporter